MQKTISKISEAGLELIKQFEGCRLQAYQDGGGIWTIGYGHTAGVHAGMILNPEEAEVWLAGDVHLAAEYVDRKVGPYLTQNQLDALVSFVFNVGAGSFCGSTLLRLINAGEFAAAADEFPKWCHIANTVSPGLVRRRAAERALFLTPDGAELPKAA